MGNAISYIGSHGKRLLNRYNAQFRALKFIEEEKLPNPSRHALRPDIEEDPMIYENLLKKDPDLDTYLKDVYVKSTNEEPLVTDQKSSKRPLPVYTGRPKRNIFQEPAEVIKGRCTLSQFFEFRGAHDNDPVENSAAAIAKNYSLDVKKVENLLKYYTLFTVHQVERKETEPPDLLDMPLPQLVEMIDKAEKKAREIAEGKTENDSLQSESRQAKKLN